MQALYLLALEPLAEMTADPHSYGFRKERWCQDAVQQSHYLMSWKLALDSPDFDPSEAIAQQIRLLELQYKHIGEFITFAHQIKNKGVMTMNFDVFDKSEIEKYEAEVKANGAIRKRIRSTNKRKLLQMKVVITRLHTN